MSEALQRVGLYVGHGTWVRMNQVTELAGSGRTRLSVDYTFLRRGRQARRQILRHLQRVTHNALVRAVGQAEPGGKWGKQVARADRWNARHLRVASLADGQGLGD